MASAIGYARISVNLDEGELSLDAQIAEIRRFADERGYQVKRVYRERTSGSGPLSSKTRPQLSLALRQAKKRHHQLIVADFSRVRPSFSAELAEYFANRGILSARAGEHADDDDAREQTARRLLELKKNGQRSRNAAEARKRKGLPVGNNTASLEDAQRKGAASNRKLAQQRSVEFDDLEAEAKRSGAKTAKQIAEALNTRGHKTAQGLPWTEGIVHRERGKSKARKVVGSSSPGPSPPTKPPVYAADHRLTPSALDRFETAMAAKKFKPRATGKLMKEMGFSRHDVSIVEALSYGGPMKQAFREPFLKWLEGVEATYPKSK